MPKTSPRIIAAKILVHALALTPLAILAWQFHDVWRNGSDALGADPVAEIEHRTGLWALRLLMVALAVTPLRQLTGQSALLRFRRMLGLYAFFYATLHLAVYLGLDLRGYWTQIFEDIVKRPYITVGFTAWLLLVPLAVTSTLGWMRRLGR
ncbi:MAG TPA: protein-methionine-sulfoxide reductase heme-binding subunit MsrQ, partial [Pseudoxanthomonas sp.]|nr:protein-methionine-sulfoxide reductase heme-binding subunit MsrQ [Pseudoxanthomonas sp.]